MVALVQQEKYKLMMRFITVLLLVVLFASCRSTKKIQTAITKKDTSQLVHTMAKADSPNFIRSVLQQVNAQKLDFKTFSAKINVDYRDADQRDYNVNTFVRIYKDSLIWVSVNALLGIEALRAEITKDSVKILDKQNKIYRARSIDYLQHVTNLPFDFKTLQDILIGNPAFIDSNVVSYTRGNGLISLVSLGFYFKSTTSFDESSKTLQRSKVDDVDVLNNRSADFVYSDYDYSAGVAFPKKRRITVVGKGPLDVSMDFRQYEFNPKNLSTPFTIPKNYKRD